MTIDRSKEQNLGNFGNKLQEAGYHKKEMKPHSPRMNLCEGDICELKRGSARKILKQNVSKKLWVWDYCL